MMSGIEVCRVWLGIFVLGDKMYNFHNHFAQSLLYNFELEGATWIYCRKEPDELLSIFGFWSVTESNPDFGMCSLCQLIDQ